MYSGSKIERAPNPRDSAGIVSLLTFFFTRGIFKKSLKCELEESDVYEVLKTCRAQKLGDELAEAWRKELKKDHTSLTKVLVRVFGKEYMFYGVLNLLIRTTTMAVKSIATGKLVSYFSPDSPLTANDAYLYGAAIVMCMIINLTFTHYYMISLNELGLRIKISLCSLIYRKSLFLSSTSLMEVTNGKIVTLITKDSQIFTSALVFGNDLWVGLIRVAVMAYIMYRQIQSSALAGLAFLIMLIPLQTWIGVKTKDLRLKTASLTDARLKRIQEILTSIKLIKLHTWEDYYTKLTNLLRADETRSLRNIFYLKSIVLAISELSYRISFYICIALYSYLGNTLTAEKVFTVITCYGSLFFVLSIAVPMSISQFAEAKSSLKRIKSYLLIKNIEDFDKQITGVPKIAIKNVRVKFANKVVLRDINFDATEGLIGISGTVGGGKSTFLKTILKDLELLNGHVNINGDVSYASQEPWLFPGTIRQNILFGASFDKERYLDVIKVCALGKDFKSFPNGDMTVVTDKGLNLSKGQQARINLARAVYKKSEIYLLDDIFSALDAKVGEYIFDKCIANFLEGKIRVVVCHNKNYLKRMNRVFIFENGRIEHEGTFEELVQKKVDFGIEDRIDLTVVEENGKVKVANIDAEAEEDCHLLMSQETIQNLNIYQEYKEKGNVNGWVYREYFRHAGGLKLIPIVLLICFVSQVGRSYFDYFITKWLKIEQSVSSLRMMAENNLTYHVQRALDIEEENRASALNWYTLIISISTILAVLRMFSFFTITSRASRKLHESVFKRITKATMTFYDKNLSGNILNRFSKDIGTIDENLPYTYYECLRMCFVFICVASLIAMVNAWVLIPTASLMAIMLYARVLFLRTSNSLRRLDGITRAPVVGFLNSSLEGLTTIRATGNQEILRNQFDRHQDLNSSVTYMYLSTSRAFGFWLDFLCSIYVTFILISFIAFHNKLENIAGDVGLALTQSFSLMGLLQWGIRQWTETENLMTSVERVLEYKGAPQECLKGSDPDNWPTKGRIEYKSVSLKYSNSDTFVLKDVNLVIEPSQKIGVIGRTGAGKSSIISVLFRLYDIEGEILIDGMNISDLELHLLRSKISIIPQDPVLFEGTIRSNLDPKGEHSDLELWRILGEVELKLFVEELKMGLTSEIKEGGANFSIGQRQLFCLARAALRNNKILVLDEATANLDPSTDELMQKTIKKLFHNCTILTIAHRLNTVFNSDKIMVVDGGRVLEFDDPSVLLRKRSGMFYSMSKQAGLVD